MQGRSYSDYQLAQVYDPINSGDWDIRYYMELAGEIEARQGRKLHILDMGCGTGWLAVELARLGHRVTGVDPAPGMLQVAQYRENTELVYWVQSDSVNFKTEARFDLILMTGHVFQVFLEDETVLSTLKNMKAHLALGGVLAFESRNPFNASWKSWLPQETTETVAVPDVGDVTYYHDILKTYGAYEGEYVTFLTVFRFPNGEEIRDEITLRFMTQERLDLFLQEAGFKNLVWFGDWEKTAYDFSQNSDSPKGQIQPEIMVQAS